jgi:glycosyltransferase involved in cell wall biosynthesis
LVIHEAAMTGVPVVGARMGGISELISEGENGLLYDAHSADLLANALRSLIEDPTLVRRLAGGQRAVKSMGEDAESWEEVYGGLPGIGRRSGPSRAG